MNEVIASGAATAPDREEPCLKERIAERWGARSATYDGAYGHGFCDETHRRLWLSALERNTNPGQGLRVLDVGCGTGFLSLLFAEMGCAVTGIDMAPDMLALARSKAEAAGLAIAFLDGDAEDPPFDPESFDLIVCRHVVWTLPDPEAAFRNWRRILAPDGRVMPVEGTWTARTVRQRLAVRLANLLERVVPTPGYDPGWQERYPGGSAELPFFDGPLPEDVAAALLRAGFDVLAIDGLGAVIAHERAHAPLGRKPFYWPGRRYLVVAQKNQGN